MSYSVLTITTRPDCQALINIATAEKDDMDYRRTGLVRQNNSATGTSLTIESSLAAVNAELGALATIIAALPPGPTLEENLVKQKKADYKKFLLEQRRINYGPIARVEREYDIARLDEGILESDAFIAELTARMNELPV